MDAAKATAVPPTSATPTQEEPTKLEIKKPVKKCRRPVYPDDDDAPPQEDVFGAYRDALQCFACSAK
eukprot:m.359065 g.359065  ORF g.359065 m.359065 type:complete len:67 (+) comp18392_c0_seq1:523-723(+)